MGGSSRFGFGYTSRVLGYRQLLLASGADRTNYSYVLELVQRVRLAVADLAQVTR